MQSSITFALGANVENLTLIGSANINGAGNGLANVITGNSGNNILDGGAGADTMIGGTGNDTYVVDVAGDVVTEAFNEGTDTVRSSITYALTANVENLILTGSANINGTGNGLANTITGNGGDNALDGGVGADTMIGGAGNDTYMVDNAGDVAMEALNEGTDLVQSSISFTLGANVENLTLAAGAGNINGTGNGLANVITGNSGNNLLDGGAGADTMVGGLGNDTYVVDDAGDVVTEAPLEGTDLVQSSISYTLGNNVENLTLTGSANINGLGNALANMLIGNSGDNSLDGITGADTMVGGAGNDFYRVDDVGDVVTELLNEGTDTVQSSISYTLSANVENLTLTGSANFSGTGNGLDNVIIGNIGDNVLTGGGNDTLDGGFGADTMVGGTGNDTYIVDVAGDVVTEALNEGTDTVRSSISLHARRQCREPDPDRQRQHQLAPATSSPTSSPATAATTLLDGGAGADTMTGGLGNDTYVVDNVGDVVVELANQGTDTVQSSFSYTLGANVENLTLTGALAIDGTGDGGANFITGNSAANTLSGLAGDNVLDGGLGDDTLIGGLGDDMYVVDSINDVVVENVGEGTDMVDASIHYRLGANFENLMLLGSADLQGYGNADANQLTGNAGNNLLDGGVGADLMHGGLGNDVFFADDASDVATENVGEGNDTVFSTAHMRLSANVENLVLQGSADLQGYGNSENNVLYGNAGSNLLIGGVGVDIMLGGAGSDVYFVDNANDIVFENAERGRRCGPFDGSLPAVGQRGGPGPPGQRRSAGLRQQRCQRPLRQRRQQHPQRRGRGRRDGRRRRQRHLLRRQCQRRRVREPRRRHRCGVLNSPFPVDGQRGNPGPARECQPPGLRQAGANTLYGNSGNNLLNGEGGADIMVGGAGNDIYFVDNIGDIVLEALNEGTDAVFSTIDYTLTANVETLVLQGTGNLSGTGNALNNKLFGKPATIPSMAERVPTCSRATPATTRSCSMPGKPTATRSSTSWATVPAPATR